MHGTYSIKFGGGDFFFRHYGTGSVETKSTLHAGLTLFCQNKSLMMAPQCRNMQEFSTAECIQVQKLVNVFITVAAVYRMVTNGSQPHAKTFPSLCISYLLFRSPSLFYLLVHSRCRRFLFSLYHTHTSQSAGLLWTSDRPVAQTSTSQHKHCTRQTSMPPVGFKPTIPASARPQTYALDRKATGIGLSYCLLLNILCGWYAVVKQCTQ
jgi:hypothetical protein